MKDRRLQWILERNNRFGEHTALVERPGIVKRHGKTTERLAVREEKMGLFGKGNGNGEKLL
jgi:hypothetical protein